MALTYDRATFAVMMASPADLEDFAVGFSLSEGIIASPADINELDVLSLPAGVECRMSLAASSSTALEQRRRRIIGPAGCGLCGMDSLEQAIRAPATVTAELSVPAAAIAAAFAGLPAAQPLNRETRAVHAAALFDHATGSLLVREDIGRHNALDKLVGAVRRAGLDAAAGILLLTSRVSIELVQKAAVLGAPILAAISVPSARAVRDAEAAGITLIAVARDDGFEVFSHPRRIVP